MADQQGSHTGTTRWCLDGYPTRNARLRRGGIPKRYAQSLESCFGCDAALFDHG